MSFFDRAVALHRRTSKPWIKPQAFHVHPKTAERMDRECWDMRFIPLQPGDEPLQLEQIKGVPVVRDPRVPKGVIALQFKSITGWRLTA